MAGISHIDEIIDYKKKVVDILGESKEVVGLILNNPDVNMGSNAALDIIGKNIFDYNYVDGTQLEVSSVIMVETEIPRIPTNTIKDMTLYVQVVVSKDYMGIDNKKFSGMRGNRRDNLVRQIDLLLNSSKDFGIGRLKLDRVVVSTAPDGYSSTMLTYSVSDFAKDRRLGHVKD